jgi:hypothetical protein
VDPPPENGAYKPQTHGDTLRYALAFALSKVRYARHRLGLSEEARYQVADETIKELRRYGHWKELDNPLPDTTAAAQHPNDKRRPWAF